MIIIWIVDTTYSFAFYPNFTKWSIYLDDNVENKVFYRIGEGVIKVYSAVLLSLGFILLIYCKMICCGIINYQDDSNQDDFAEDYFEENNKKHRGHSREIPITANVSSQL